MVFGSVRRGATRKGTLRLVIFAGCFGAAVHAQAQTSTLAREEIRLYGLTLKVEPAQQTVPKGIATIVSAFLQTATPPENLTATLADAEVRATLRGPSFTGPLELVARPNTPFNIPPLGVPGLHTLENVRLINKDGVLLRGTPESATIDVIDKLLVTQVSTRALTAAEIREKGIVFDKSNFQAFNFSAAFAIGDHKVDVSFPVVLPTLAKVEDDPERIRLDVPSITPPLVPTLQTLIPDTLKLQAQIPNLSVVGFMMDAPALRDQGFSVPPIPGVVVIPGDIGFLNQFFSVMLMVGNVAPAGSNLTVSNVTADIVLPPGKDGVVGSGDDPLAMARTAQGEVARTQPVVQPGGDGRLGTSDDVTTIGPGETGNAEYLVEGRREGSHVVEMEIKATLHGLPAGPVEVRGRAAGSVLVRNPAFTLTFTHPEVVNAGETYDLDVTVTNTSTSPANFVAVNLYPRNVSGATLVGDSSRQIESIGPGDSSAISFTLRSLRTGKVTAATLDSDENVAGRFSLKAAIGELGVPLSPDSLVLPKEAASLAPGLREAAIALLGKAYAVATAPAAALPKDTRRFSKKIVLDRAVAVAEAGFRVRLHEPAPDSAAQLFMDFAGSDYRRLADLHAPEDLAFEQDNFAGFDEVRRRSIRGDAFAAAVAAELSGAMREKGIAAFHQGLAEKWSYRPGHISVVVGTGGGALPFTLSLEDSHGRRVGGMDASGKVLKEIPFSDFMSVASSGGSISAQMAVLAAPDAGDYQLVLRRAPGTPFDTPYTVSVVMPSASGELRQIVHDLVGRGPPSYPSNTGASYRVSTRVLDGDVVLTEGTAPPRLDHAIADPPPTLLGVVQQAEADVIACMLDSSGVPPIPAGRVVAALFSEEITRATAEDPSHYTPDGNATVAASLQPGRRIVYLALRDPIGPFVPRQLTLSSLSDNRGQLLSTQSVPIEATMDDQAGVVSGRIRRADGTTVPFADVRLFYWMNCELTPPHWEGIAAKQAATDGSYSFDYVTRLAPSRIVVTDRDTEDRRDVRFSVQRNGQRMNVDLVFLGRATFQGRTLAENGTPLAGTFVKVTSLTDESQYQATTDANGRFAIFRIPVGNIVIEAVNVAAGARIAASENLPTAGAAVTRDITLLAVESPGTVTVKKGDLRGHVFRADGVTPARTVPVVLYYRSGSQAGVTCGATQQAGVCGGPNECAIGFARTNADGAYSFLKATAGELCVNSFDQGGLEQGGARIALPADGAGELNVLLSGGLGTVRGTVLDPNGRPVPGAKVGGGLSLTTTDANGAFVLTDVPIGRREIVAVSETLKTQGSATIDLSRPGEEVNVTIVMAAVGSVAGQVLAADGVTPAARNKVYLFTKEVRQEFEEVRVYASIVAEATTDDQGRFRIDGVHTGAYEISAFRPDFKDGNTRPVVLKYQGQVARADLRFRGGGGRVAGTVFGADGQTPLSATVSVSGDQVLVIGPLGVMFQTVRNFKTVDADLSTGQFVLDGVWVGPFTVRAAGQFSPDPIVVQGTMPSAGATVELNIRLQPTSQVRGTVRLPDGVTPAAKDLVVKYQSAAYQVICTEGDFGDEVCAQHPVGIQDERVVTDEQGQFRFAVVNPGAYTITVEDPVTGKTGQSHGVVRAGETGDLDVRLLGIGELTVVVLSSDGITPIPNAKVEVAQTGYPQKKVTLIADLQGAVVFAGGDAFSEGELVVAATDVRNGFAGRASGRIVSDGQHVTVRVFLYDATGTVFGTVFRSDRITRVPNAEYVLSKPAGDQSVALAFGVTDADGTYRVEQIPLGPFSVDVFEAATARRGYATARIDLSGQEVPANVFEDALGVVKGHGLEGGTLAPLKGWDASLQQTSPSGRAVPSLRATTGVDGSFFFPGVSQGTFSVRLARKDVSATASASGRIEREGQSVDVPLIVNIEHASFGAIEGVVFNPDGTPAANSPVEVCVSPCDPDRDLFRTTTGSDGVFSLAPLPLGRFAATARSQVGGNVGTASGELSLDGEVAQIQVVLVGLTEIRGFVERGNGQRADGVEVSLTGSPSSGCDGSCTVFTNANGEFAFHGVPARTFTIVARDVISGLKASIGGVLDPGETREVRLVLEPTARISGRVLLPRGAPAAGIVAELSVFTLPARSLFVETGANGVFSFDGVPLAAYRLSLFDPVGGGEASRSGQLLADASLGDVRLDDSPPSVTSIVPASGSIAVPRNASVRVVFSEPLAAGSVNASTISLSSAAGVVSATLTSSDDDTAVTLTPLAPLRDETTYTVRVRGVTDRIGKALAGEQAASFTTVDVTPPIVIESSPPAGLKGVALDSVVRVKFNEPFDPGRFTGPAIRLSSLTGAVDGRVDFLFGNTVLVFTPARLLAEDVVYRVEVDAVADRTGNVQAQGLEYTFTTSDRTPPQVVALVPSNQGQVIEGATASVTAELDGSHDVAAVDFYLNDVFAFVDRMPPFEMSFQASAAVGRPGDRVKVSAVATDVSGNRGTTPAVTTVTILLDQPPSIAIGSPADGTVAANGERITVALAVRDDLGVRQAGYKAQTGRPQDASTRTIDPPGRDLTVTFGFNVPVDAAPGSSIRIDALAVDTKGQLVQAAPVTLRVRDAVAPVVKITGASSGQRLLPGQQTTIVVTADDAGGVTRVRFRASGVVALDESRAIDPAQPSVATAFTFLVPAASHPPQSVTLEADAVDPAGNTGTAASVILPVADTVRPTIRLRTESGSHAIVPGRPVRVVADVEDETSVGRVELRGQGAFAVSDAKPVSPPAGSASIGFDLLVPEGLPEGATLDLEAVAVDTGGNTSVAARLALTVAALSDVILPASEIVVAGEVKAVAVQLSLPAPAGGLQVDLVSENPSVASPTAPVMFAAGETSKVAAIAGVSGGTTFVNAIVRGVQRASMTATVRGGIVRGTVFDAELRPIAGAQLTIDGSVAAVADGHGAYGVEGISGPDVIVKAIDPVSKRRGVAQGRMNLANGHARIDVVVVAAGAIRGRVLRADAQTPAGAGVKVDVFAASAPGSAVQTTFTKADGAFEFPLLGAGEYVLDAAAIDGSRGRSSSIVIGAGGEEVARDVVYLGRGSAAGVVLDGGGKPVPNARLTFRASSLFGGETRQENAGADGRFRFDGVFIGGFSVEATDLATGLVARGSGQIARDQERVSLELKLSGHGSVQGRVFRAGETPAAGASVSVAGRSTTTDTEGRYTVALVPLGAFTVSASDEATHSVGLASGVLEAHGQTKTVDVTFFGQGTVAVTVQDADGHTVAGASIKLNVSNGVVSDSLSATTASDGTAVVAHVLAGTFSVVATSGSLAGTAHGTVGAGGIQAVTIVLPRVPDAPTASISGTVYEPDGRTPVAAGDVQVRGTRVPIAADGTFRADGLDLGSYVLTAFDVQGRRRAFVKEPVVLQERGQIATRTLSFVAMGEVTGRVLLPDGSSAAGLAVTITDQNPDFGATVGAGSNAAGFYQRAGLAVGPIRVTVSDPSSQLWGEAGGVLSRDGDTITIDVLLQANVVELPLDRYDGNNMRFRVQHDGSMLGSAGPFLDVVQGGASTRFAGEGQATGEAQNREIVTRQTIGALEITRKTYVSPAGYFARALELVRNTGSEPATIDLGVSLAPSPALRLITTSSGDDVLDGALAATADRWLTLDDDVDEDPFLRPNEPALAFVFDGAEGAERAAAGLAPACPACAAQLTYRWNAIAVAPGETVGYLHFVVQQLTRAAARASAERLVGLPPEALAGVSAEELAEIRNFKMPLDGVSAEPPLPPLSARVGGTVFEGDGTTAAGGALVRFRSDNLFFGRTYSAGTDGQGSFALGSSVNESGSTVIVAADAFQLDAVHPRTAVIAPAVTGAFGDGETTASRNVVFSNTGLLVGRVRRHTNVVVTAGSVSVRLDHPRIDGTAAIGSDAQYRFSGLPAGTYSLAASVVHQQGTGLSGTGTAQIADGELTRVDLTIEPTGGLRGTVRRGSAPVADVDVYLSRNGFLRTARTDTAGVFSFADVPLGSFIVRAVDPATGLAASANVAVAVDATAVQDLSLVGLGVVQVETQFARGTPAEGAAVSIQETARGGGFRSVGVTNGSGRLNISNVTTGSFTVRVSHPASSRFAVEIAGAVDTDAQSVPVAATLPPVGAVVGAVTRADGSSVAGVTVRLTFAHPQLGGAFSVVTGGGGIYRFDEAPMGAFAAIVSDVSNGLFGDTPGVLTQDGEEARADISLLDRPVTLPRTRYDAGNFTFDLRTDGSIGAGTKDVYAADLGAGASILEILAGGVTSRLAGRSIATVEEDGQEIASLPEAAGPLHVRRKAYVPRDGYFARYIDELRNTSAEPVAATLRVLSHVRLPLAAAPRRVIATSSGDDVLDVAAAGSADRWVVVGDDLDQDPFESASLPALAFVMDGAGAADRVGAASFSVTSGALLAYEWTVVIPPGASVSYLHFLVQQIGPAAARASAERLVQLPPEALAGLDAAERASVRNFAVPADGVSALAPLPALVGTVRGRTLAVDGSTTVPNAPVRFRSRHTLFGRTHALSSDGAGAFAVSGRLADDGTTVAVPEDAFTLEATHPDTSVVAAANGTFAGGAIAERDVVFSNTGMVSGVARRHSGAPIPQTPVLLTRTSPAYARSSMSGADGRYAFTGLTGGSFTLSISVPHPQGSPLTGLSVASVAEGHSTAADVVLVPTGNVAGVLSNGDGTPAAGVRVELSGDLLAYSATSGPSGGFTFAGVPVGAYTLSAVEPRTGIAATAPVSVAVDQAVARDLTLVGVGSVPVQVSFTNGAPAANAQVFIQEALRGSFRQAGSTNAAGLAIVSNVPAGAFTVRVSHPALSAVTRDVAGEMPATGGTVATSVTLPLAVTVPGVTGLPQADAESALAAAKLSVGAVTSEYSDAIAEGAVLRQSLAPGSLVLEGSPVSLAISLGRAPACVPAPGAIVAFWTGDTDARDLVTGAPGNLRNGASIKTGRVGGAFGLDGVDDHVEIADEARWDLGANFTIELWANFAAVRPENALVSHDEGRGSQNKWILWVTGDGLSFHVNTPSSGEGSAVSAPFTPVANRWYHLAVTRNGPEYVFYVDGVVVGSATSAQPVPGAAAPLVLGQAENAFRTEGLIDEVAIYRRALSASEIQSVADAGAGGTCRTLDLTPPLVAAIAPVDQAIQVPAGAVVVVTFSEPLGVTTDAATLITIDGPSGRVPGTSVFGSATTATFTPAVALPSNGVYSVTVNGAVDAADNRQTTPFTSSFMTIDTTPPVLQAASPAPGGLANTVRPAISIAMLDTLTGVDPATAVLAIDGVPVAASASAVSITFTPAADLPQGSHAVQATVQDRAANAGTLAFPFTIDSLPPGPAQIVGVVDGQVASGVVAVGASADDGGSGIDRIELSVDGVTLVSLTPPSLAAAVDTRVFAEGPHFLTAFAVDRAGNPGPAGPAVRLIVDNQPGVVLISSPLELAPAGNSVLVSASVSEAVDRVELSLGNETVVDRAAPYEATFDLAGQPEGPVQITVVAYGIGVAAVTATRTVVVDHTPPAAPDAAKITAEPPDVNGLSLVFGQAGAVESGAGVEAADPSKATATSGKSGPDGSFVLSLGAGIGDALSLVAVDAAGNRSSAATVIVRTQPTPTQGTIDVSFLGSTVDRVATSSLSPDSKPDAVFAIALDVGAGVTRRLLFIDIAGPGIRSTRPGAGAVLGVAADLGAPLLNRPEGDVGATITSSGSLLLFAADEGFIQHGGTYAVTAVFVDGSRFAGTLANLQVPLKETASPVFSVNNIATPDTPPPDAKEATSGVFSVRNASVPPVETLEAGETTSAVFSVKNGILPGVSGPEPNEAIGQTFSVKNGAVPATTDTGAMEAVGTVFSVKNVNGMPPPGVLQFSSATYPAGEGAGSVLVTVTRTNGSDGFVAVDYATADLSATAGADYVAAAGRLTFGPGDTIKTFTVAILDDVLSETTETIQLTLGNPAGGAMLGPLGAATIAIADNDAMPVLSIEATSVLEGDAASTTALVTVRLSAPSGQEVSVDYATSAISATPGADYAGSTGRLVFVPGSTTETIAVPIFGDLAYEADETFAVDLTNATGAAIGSARAIVTILNDDPRPQCVAPPADLVGWWPFDGHVLDIVGGSDGSLHGGVAFSSGEVREALAFDGVDGVVTASDGRLPMGGAARTLEFWLKPAAAGVPVLYGSPADNDAFFTVVSGDRACIGRWGSAPAECGTRAVTDGEWHHVALTYNGGGDVRLYVDGQFEAATTRTYSTSATGTILFGATFETGRQYYRGLVDEVAIYNRALDPAEIEAIVRAGSEGKCSRCAPTASGIASAWAAESTAGDRVGANHGALFGGGTFAAGQVGQAFALDGSGAYVEVPSSATLPSATGQFSVEFWAHPLPHASSGLVTQSDNHLDGPGWAFAYYGTSGGPNRVVFVLLSSYANVQTAASATGAVPFNQWTHVAGTSDGTTMRLYVNGVEVAQSPSPAVLPSPFSMLMGAYQRNGVREQFFKGSIDEVNVYGRVLSAAEIRGIVNAARAGVCR